MKAEQQPPTDSVREQVVEVTAVGALAFFCAFMVFLGWLKYRDRNKKAGKGSKKRPPRSNKK